MTIEFLLGGSVVAVLLVQIIKAIVGKLESKYGSLITQVVVLLASFFVAGIGAAFKLLPPEIVQTTLTVFASAVAIYEVFYKAIYQQAIRSVK